MGSLRIWEALRGSWIVTLLAGVIICCPIVGLTLSWHGAEASIVRLTVLTLCHHARIIILLLLHHILLMMLSLAFGLLLVTSPITCIIITTLLIVLLLLFRTFIFKLGVVCLIHQSLLLLLLLHFFVEWMFLVNGCWWTTLITVISCSQYSLCILFRQP